MADNVGIATGAGATVATDDDGVAHHQYVKLEFGADNTQTKVTATDPLPVTLGRASTATLANVAGSATSVTLLAANAARMGAVVVNDSTEILYLKFGSAASATSFTYKMRAGDTLELAQPVYSGIITGLWAAAAGSARVTELTL